MVVPVLLCCGALVLWCSGVAAASAGAGAAAFVALSVSLTASLLPVTSLALQVVESSSPVTVHSNEMETATQQVSIRCLWLRISV